MDPLAQYLLEILGIIYDEKGWIYLIKPGTMQLEEVSTW